MLGLSPTILDKVIGVLLVTFLALSLLDTMNGINLALYPLQITVGIVLAVLVLRNWWQTHRPSPFIRISALLLMVLFTIFIIFEDLGVLHEYPFFTGVCLVAALMLIAYLIHRTHVARKASHKSLKDKGGMQ